MRTITPAWSHAERLDIIEAKCIWGIQLETAEAWNSADTMRLLEEIAWIAWAPPTALEADRERLTRGMAIP